MKQIFIFCLFLLISNNSSAQQLSKKDHSRLNINCQTCHTCEVPTRTDPCLIMCPREKIVTIYQKPEKTPELIVIDQLKEKYGAVYFSHRIHAQMSEMSGGCSGCHHFNTTGPILNCNSCHVSSRKRENVSIPDLKAAYHRQCMDCHREWSDNTSCNSCHLPIKDVKGTEKEQIAKKISGKEHPVITEPTKIVYKTNSEKGKFATFFHDDHSKKFNIDCISCHKRESCSSCHDVKKKTTDEKSKISNVSKVKLSFKEQHKNCISCHGNDKCQECHSDKELVAFDHLRSSGWALKAYHAKLECQKCHGSKMPFTKIDRNCVNCHKNWNNETFKHSVTGLKLDEIHAELSCEDCHLESNFSTKPGCDGCHEGYTYPKQKPGKLIGK